MSSPAIFSAPIPITLNHNNNKQLDDDCFSAYSPVTPSTLHSFGNLNNNKRNNESSVLSVESVKTISNDLHTFSGNDDDTSSNASSHQVPFYYRQQSVNICSPLSHDEKVESKNYHLRYNLPSFEDTTFVIFGYGSILWKQEFEFQREFNCFIKGYKRVFYQGTSIHRGTPDALGRVATLIPCHNNDNDDVVADSKKNMSLKELIAAEGRVYGRAFQLPSDPEKLNKIFENLDVRETGYRRINVELFSHSHATIDSSSNGLPLDIFSHSDFTTNKNASTEKELEQLKTKNIVCLCYLATEDNAEYMGPASPVVATSSPLISDSRSFHAIHNHEENISLMAAEIVSRGGISGTNREYVFRLAGCLRAMGVIDEHMESLEAATRALMYSS